MVSTSGVVGSRTEAKREQILAGARRVFLREGFSGASTDVISREAGVSKRTLYAYYPTKEDLFAGVLRHLTIDNPQTRVLESVRRIDPNNVEELRRGLIELAGKSLRTMMDPDYLALLRTIIADSHRFPQLGELFRQTVPERGMGEGRAMLERAQENGVAVQGDPEIMTRVFIGPLLTYALVDGLFRPESEPRPPEPEKVEKIVELYMKAITNEGTPSREELERNEESR